MLKMNAAPPSRLAHLRRIILIVEIGGPRKTPLASPTASARIFRMTPEQKQKVGELRKWRLKQPYMTSEEALEQMQRIRRNVAARSGSDTSSNETPSPDGRAVPAASSLAQTT